MSLDKIVILTGGTGTVKLIQGFYDLCPENLTIVCNTGDDWNFYGLHVSPDTDSLLYALSNQLDRSKHWGIVDDTFNTQNILQKLDNDKNSVADWFNLGDKDLGHCLFRTYLLQKGKSLTETTHILANRLKIKTKIFPMSNEKVNTYFHTLNGVYHIEEYFLKIKKKFPINQIEYRGASYANLASELKKEISEASLLIIGPSNPISSIGPILAISELKQTILESSARKVAVSPIIGKKAVSGPAAEYMEAQGFEVSPEGIYNLYREICDIFIFHETDNVEFGYLGNIAKEINKKIYFRNILFDDENCGKFADWLLKLNKN